jgi:putative transposase
VQRGGDPHAETYYRWRKEYDGMKVEQARRLKELEKENGWLKRLVADVGCMWQ